MIDSLPIEVADALHSAAIHLLRAVRRVDDETGLSPARLSALSVIVFGGPVTVGELAAAESIRSPSATSLVTALENDGLVRRVPNPADQRSVHVHATLEGRHLLDRARARRLELLAGRLARLDEDELVILRTAARLMENLAKED
jgi:DNA-binding MarR family transcriptional regulator